MTTPSAPAPSGGTNRRAQGLLLIAVALVFGYLVVSAFEPLRLNWGDPWSDANVLTALNFSSRDGFLKTSFTDVLDIGPLTAESYRYTHYPPLAEIFYGCVTKVAGHVLDISVYRLFGILFAAVGLRAFHRYVTGVWGKEMATWAAILCATNLLWLQFADSIHQSPVLFATGMTALAGVPGWVKEGRPRQAAAIGIGTYLCFLVAYDYYFFVPTVALLTARVLGVPLLSKRMIKLAALIAVCGMLSIATKAGFVIGALGWHGFVEDLGFQFLERATTKFSPDYRVGIITVLLLRWTSYFTPALFVAVGALVVAMVRDGKRAGAWRSVRALFVGTEALHEHPASILLLLVAAIPFLLVFSELSAEQVLPSQVLVPFYAASGAWLVTSAGRRRAVFSQAALGLFVAWQLLHLARVPKTFLDRDGAARVREFLRQNDRNDFLITNIMADGPVQYYFERHLHPPADRVERAKAGYAELTNITRSGIIHAVYFEDPGTRFIDKSLWPLLAARSRWAIFGYPYLFRSQAMAAIEEWDGRVIQGLEQNGTEVLHVPGMRVFRIGKDGPSRRADLAKQLTEPTRYIDFGKKEADAHKLAGFRFAENYPDVPGFCWTIAQGIKRTVLTKRGLVYTNEGAPKLESTLLLRFEPGHAQRIRLLTWGSLNDEILAATIAGKVVLPPTNLGKGQTRTEISFVVPKELVPTSGDPVTEVVFTFNDVAEFGGGVSFAIMHIDPIDEAP